MQDTFGDEVANEQGFITITGRKARNRGVRRVRLEFIGGGQGRGHYVYLGRDAGLPTAFRHMPPRLTYVDFCKPSVSRELEPE